MKILRVNIDWTMSWCTSRDRIGIALWTQRNSVKDNEQQHKSTEQQDQETEEQYKDNKEQHRDSGKRYKDNEYHKDLSYDSNSPEVRIRYFHRTTIHHWHYTNCLGMIVMVNVVTEQCECLDISLGKGQTLERAIRQSSFL